MQVDIQRTNRTKAVTEVPIGNVFETRGGAIYMRLRPNSVVDVNAHWCVVVLNLTTGYVDRLSDIQVTDRGEAKITLT